MKQLKALVRGHEPAKIYLPAWLSTSHPTMPDFSLARDEIADLVAYIRTLGPR